MIKVYDDVLKPSVFKQIESLMLDSKEFPWYFARHNLNHENTKYKTTDTFLFTHNLFINNNPHSDAYNLVVPLLDYIKKRHPIKSLIRIKANLYTNQHKNIKYDSHIDQSNYSKTECLVAVYNIINCNGGTVINNKHFPSVANQLILFDNVRHYGITQTDTQARICINFNFATKG
tara:strand:+ start:2404 stop:2928 length:525 start_codon:yes stop_codon:yes gene_type:complete